MQLDDYYISDELISKIVLCQLYKEDYASVIRTYIGNKQLKLPEVERIYRTILASPEFEQAKQDAIAIEEASLIDDDMNTIMLQYNRLLKKAQQEGKYEVAARILKEIRQIKAIDNEQIKFEITIKVEKPEPVEQEGNQN